MVDKSIKQLKLKKNGEKRTIHPNSLANLKPTPWKPGESGNKQGYSLKSRLDDAMGKPLKPPPKDAPAVDALIYATIAGALLREPVPFREVWDRLEGKVIEKHAILQEVNVRFIIGQGYEKIDDDNQDEGN